jgi:hypothetical protein
VVRIATASLLRSVTGLAIRGIIGVENTMLGRGTEERVVAEVHQNSSIVLFSYMIGLSRMTQFCLLNVLLTSLSRRQVLVYDRLTYDDIIGYISEQFGCTLSGGYSVAPPIVEHHRWILEECFLGPGC